MWQYHPLLVIFSLGGLVSLGVALYCWRYMQTYGKSYLVGAIGVLAFNNAIWVFAATLKTASTSLDASLFFYKLQFLGLVWNPAVGLVIALAYVGKDRWLTRETFAVLGGVSAAFIALILVNPRSVMIVDPVLVEAQGIMAFEHTFPPLFTVYLAWVYGLVVLSLLILARGTIAGRVPTMPALVAILTLGLPLITAVLKSAGVYPPGGKGINVTPAASAIGISILAFTLVRYRVFELIPVGRDRAIEVMEDGYLLLGDDETVLDANPSARELLTGLDDAPVKGRPVTDLIPVYDGLDEHDTAMFSSDDRTIEVRSSPVTRQNQEAGRLLLLQDVTDRETRKRELERYERIVENVPVGVYRLTPGAAGELRFGNRALVDIFGADSKAELSEYTARDLYVDPDQRDAFLERLRSQGEITDEEIRMETVDGEQFWASVSNARVVEDGDVYFEGALQDITERKEYQREIERARERAQSERDGKEAVRQLLLQSSTDQEIAESVCRLLVNSYDYAAAWVVRDTDEQNGAGPATVAVAGDDHGFLAESDHDLDAATRRALDERTSVRVALGETDESAVRDRLAACDLHSVRSVPLAHDGVSYGVLTVVRTSPGTEFSTELVDEVAAAIAFKQQVHRQQAALTAETVVELRIRVGGDHVLSALSAAPALQETELRAHELHDDGDHATYLVETDGVDPETLRTATEAVEGMHDAAVVADAEAESTVRIQVELPTFGSVLSRYGGVIQSLTATAGRVDLTVEFPRRTDVGEVVDAVTDHWPDAEMRSRRERTVDSEALRVFDDLTEKQEEALRTATLAGFFDRPQRANASDVAETLDVSRTTFLHHLRNAERKVFEAAFDGTEDERTPERLRTD